MGSFDDEPRTEESIIEERSYKILAILESVGCGSFVVIGDVSDDARAVVDILRKAGVEVIIPSDN